MSKNVRTLKSRRIPLRIVDMGWPKDDYILTALKDRSNVNDAKNDTKITQPRTQEPRSQPRTSHTGVVIITFGQVHPRTIISYGFKNLNLRFLSGRQKRDGKNRFSIMYCNTNGHGSKDRNCPSSQKKLRESW